MVKPLQGYRVCRHVMVFALLVWMGAWAKHALAASGHQNKPAPLVVSVVPIVDRLNQALLDRTAVDILYLPSPRLPLNRIPGWLKRLESNQVPAADIVVTMESIWPPLAIYPLIRQRHIKSIPIDVANEIAPGGARLTQRAQGQEDYLWLDLNNLQKMIHILSRDFGRYWPEYDEVIQDNRQQLQQVIQQRQLFFDTQLFTAQIESVAVTDEKLLPMALSLALPIVAEQQADLVLTPTPVDKAGYWWVDPLLRPSHQSLVQWLMALEEQLQRALASRS